MTGPVQDLFAFALNLYRAPLKYRAFIGSERPVPDNFQALLETLNKRPEHEAWDGLVELQSSSVEELREAGFFLVRRVLFVDGADHYRVLGLESTANIASIRERYRLLIGLFHPDKNPQGDEWGELYAPKINDAYNVLKNPDKKRRYDQQLSTTTPASADNRSQRRAPGFSGESWGPDMAPAPARAGSVSGDFDDWDDHGDAANPFGADGDASAEEQAQTRDTSDDVVPRATAAVPPQPAKPGTGKVWLWGLVFLSGLTVGIVIGMRGGDISEPGLQTGAPANLSDTQQLAGSTPDAQRDEATRAFEAALSQSEEPMPEPALALVDNDGGTEQWAADAGENYAYAESATEKLLAQVLPRATKKMASTDPANCTGPNCEDGLSQSAQSGKPDTDKVSLSEPVVRTTIEPRFDPSDDPMAQPPLPQTVVMAAPPAPRSEPQMTPNASLASVKGGSEVPAQAAGVERKTAKADGVVPAPGKAVRRDKKAIAKPEPGAGMVIEKPVGKPKAIESLAVQTERKSMVIPVPPAKAVVEFSPRNDGHASPVAQQQAVLSTNSGQKRDAESARPVTERHYDNRRQVAVTTMATKAEPTGPSVRKPDVDRLLARFIQTYENGDVGKFVNLFARDAVTNDGVGQGVISASYGDFFTASDERSVEITDLIWSGDQNGKATLSFVVRISVNRGVFSVAEQYEGDVNMHVFLDGRQLLISEFLHKVEKL